MKHNISIAIVLLSVILVFASVYLPVTVYSQAQLAEVKLGLPLPFVSQTQYINPRSFPWETSIRFVWENPTKVLWSLFFLDVFLIWGGVSIVMNFLKAMFLRMSKH